MYSSSKTKAAFTETEALNFVYLKLCVSVIHDFAASSDLHKGVFSVTHSFQPYARNSFSHPLPYLSSEMCFLSEQKEMTLRLFSQFTSVKIKNRYL